jgi:hypothetical protein
MATELDPLKVVSEEVIVKIQISGQRVGVPRDGFSMKVLESDLATLALNPIPSLPIDLSSLDEVPSDGSPSFADGWDRTERSVIAYIVDRMEAYKGKEHLITPTWVRRYVMGMLNFVRKEACDLMVYGNDRYSVNDAIFPALGDALNVPVVSELTSLFASKCTLYIVVLHNGIDI